MTSYRDSRIYGLDEICELLKAADGYLTTRASVVIIGGAAAAFHDAESTTNDVDTNDALSADLENAIERAKVTSGLEITVSHSAVADVPWNFKDRLERKLPELTNLHVFVLERHDLALSKIMRCDEHDLQQLAEIHTKNHFDFDLLVERFRTEMDHVMGDPARTRSNFLEMIERLFGEMKRVQAERITRRG